MGSGRGWASLLFAAAAAACSAAPPAPAPGTGTLWGTVRLVPRNGVSPGAKSRTSYEDRSLRDVEFVDYLRPGFTVVYLEGPRPPDDAVEIALEGGLLGRRLSPSLAAVGSGGRLVVRNRDDASRTFSCPAAGFLRRLAPGDSARITPAGAGALRILVLDVPGLEAEIFVAPGPYAVAGATGRWELRDQPPGPAVLRAWHPRFPAGARRVSVAADRTEGLEIELGVGHLEGKAEE